MCISSAEAELSNTYEMIFRFMNKGLLNEMILYKNKMKSDEGKANCMILAVPTRKRLTKDNFINFSRYPTILEDVATSVLPASLGGSKGGRSATLAVFEVEVFDVGNYKVISADSPAAIQRALDTQLKDVVPPAVKQELIDGLSAIYGDLPMVIAYFNNATTIDAEPLVYYYEPINQELMWLPALDEHKGNAPDLKATVATDHTVLFGASEYDPSADEILYTFDLNKVDARFPNLKDWFPTHAKGFRMEGMYPNGDMGFTVFGVKRLPAGSLRNSMVRVPMHP